VPGAIRPAKSIRVRWLCWRAKASRPRAIAANPGTEAFFALPLAELQNDRTRLKTELDRIGSLLP